MENVFNNNDKNDVDSIFNSFLNTHLQIFYSYCHERTSILWITKGIKTFCQCKRELYLLTRNSSDIKLKHYYELYFKILSNVIKEGNRLNYNKQIINSHNTIKTWNMTKDETGKKVINEDIFFMNKDDDENNNCKVNSELFNNYFFNDC